MEKVSKKIERKGYWLLKQGKVKKELETDKRIHFLVLGESKDHSVIFEKEKNEFRCDCEYFSLHFKPCSHVYACKLFLKSKR
jgi:uncharacterized Zn finger protein